MPSNSIEAGDFRWLLCDQRSHPKRHRTERPPWHRPGVKWGLGERTPNLRAAPA